MSLNVVRKLVLVGSLLSVATMIAACASTSDTNEEGETTSATAEDLKCASSVSTKLAAAGLKQNGKKSQHRCYAFVKSHMRAAGMSTAPVDAAGDGVGAYQFGVWAKKNPAGLKKMGLVSAPNLSLSSLPKGAILVWARGQCGFSKQYGHIEVVVDDNSTKACSDFCWSFKKTCGKPDIYIPAACGPQATPVSGEDPATAPAEDGDDDDDDTSTTTATADAGAPTTTTPSTSTGDDDDDTAEPAPTPSTPAPTCFSETLNTDVSELTCVESSTDGVYEQCHNGQWYRTADDSGDTGPYGACVIQTH